MLNTSGKTADMVRVNALQLSLSLQKKVGSPLVNSNSRSDAVESLHELIWAILDRLKKNHGTL